MALFDDQRREKVAPEDAVVIAHRFVSKCREWALKLEIPKRSQRLAARSTREEGESLAAWLQYVVFLDRTLAELEDGTLDAWFVEPEGEQPEKGGA